MKTIIVSISAKNIHKMLAAWCLKSYCENMGLSGIEILEVSINNNLNEIVSRIYKSSPNAVAFSCYIWNIDYINKIGGLIKKLMPDCVVILGGPEVSFEESLNSYPFADYLIGGAGEVAIYELLYALNQNIAIEKRVINGCNENFSNYPSPYTEEYFESFKNNQISTIANQLIYYESARGCPFSCSYCLSSTINGLHFLPLERVKADLLLIIQKGAKCIKFVDRTFNSVKKRAKQILDFIYSLDTDCTFHFEVAADLFDDELLAIVKKMPVARIQFEIGIQSINKKTLDATTRKTDIKTVLKNIATLTSFQNCHVHVDLIAGLPHETLATFEDGINACILCKPHMLQLGFLKMLKGTRIRSENSHGEIFADFPPYEVYQTNTMSYGDIIKLKKIESIIERFYNSGAYESAINYAIKLFGTPYKFFEMFAEYIGTDNFDFKVSMKNAYTTLLTFLLQYGDKREAEHSIKLDCLSYDARLLPDTIKHNRNKNKEIELSKQTNLTNFNVEYFEFDNKYRLFNYESRNKISNKFEIKELS